jgi:hypothetical protein
MSRKFSHIARFSAGLLVGLLSSFASTALAGTQLPHGRYVGYMKIEGRIERLALQADFFLESPEDQTRFPQLEAIVKMSLGGYHTSEYITYVYKNIRTDFDRGTLIFDEPSSDLVFNGKVESGEGFARIEGNVWMRSSATAGRLVLDLVSDEPGDEPERKPDPDSKLPFAPALDGQYEGKCDNQSAVFQMQTARALRIHEIGNGAKAPFDYEVVARLGYRNKPSPVTGSQPWSAHGSFAGGSYDPFRGRLVFWGPSSTTIECARSVGELACTYRIPKTRVRCRFERVGKDFHDPAIFPRRFHVATTNEQLKPLPLPGSIPDDILAGLLDGHYSGFLHHDASDRYQPVALRVLASVSTENPHNPNKVFVSTTSVLYFGSLAEGHFVSHRYEPRSFYVRPGFALNAPGTDSFIMITEWTSGSIRGIWYSQTFGRVGTVEVIKGKVPAISPDASAMRSWRGDFNASMVLGHVDPTKPGQKVERWFSVVMPNQPAERLSSTVIFFGSFQSLVGLTKIEPIERGTFDPYSGAIAWSFKFGEGLTIVSGNVAGDGSLSMHWPPNPNAFPVPMSDYKPINFRKNNDFFAKRPLTPLK